jgi:hypothetical protein
LWLLNAFIRFAGEKLELVLKFLRLMKFTEKEVLVNQKLKEAAIKTNCAWVLILVIHKFYYVMVVQGEYFDNPITVGKAAIS